MPMGSHGKESCIKVRLALQKLHDTQPSIPSHQSPSTYNRSLPYASDRKRSPTHKEQRPHQVPLGNGVSQIVKRPILVAKAASNSSNKYYKFAENFDLQIFKG